MHKSREYVNIMAHFHRVGDPNFGFDESLSLYDFIWCEGDFEDCIADDEFKTVLKPFIGFGASTINLGKDYCSWLQHELNGYDHTILTGPDNEYLDTIRKIAEFVCEGNDKYANFVLAYDMEHRCHCYEWGCDCETQIDLVGLVDMSKLSILEV